jgi:hypothetical protein
MTEGGTPAALEPEVAAGRLVDECPECGYELTGLPDAGICPECGHDYDQSMLVLHGSARGRFANFGNAATRNVIWQIAWVVVCLVSAGATVDWSRGDPILMLILAYAGGLAAIAVARRLLSNRAGLVQVYLRPDGFLQRDYDDRTLLHTLYRVAPVVLAVAVFSLSMMLAPGDRLTGVGAAGLAVAGLILLGALVFHFVARSGRSNLEVFAHWKRPWRAVGQCLLEPVGDSRFRLRLRGQRWDSPRDLADLEFPCTPLRARRLEGLIKQWIDKRL